MGNDTTKEKPTGCTDKDKCPFLQKPFEDCYSSNLNSLKIWATLHYCGGGFFEDCEIYRYKEQ